MLENAKAAGMQLLKRLLLKALPWGIGLFVVLVVFVKVFSMGGLVSTVRFVGEHLFLITVLAFLFVGYLGFAIAGGAIKDAFEDKSTARDKNNQSDDTVLVVVKTRAERRPKTKSKSEQLSLLTVPEPPPVLEGFAALKYLLFNRDKPELR